MKEEGGEEHGKEDEAKRMRDKAKAGIHQVTARGQIGNTEYEEQRANENPKHEGEEETRSEAEMGGNREVG